MFLVSLKFREIITVKSLKSKKKKLALTFFYYVTRKIWLGNSKKLFCKDQSFSLTRENSKIFNITSKYFSFFNNKPPASWVAHITSDFLTCCPCSYYSFMTWCDSGYTNLGDSETIVSYNHVKQSVQRYVL